MLVKPFAPDSSSSEATAESVALRAVVAVAPGSSGIVADPMGESGLVAGLSATVAFGRATVPAPADPRGMVGLGAPGRGAFAVFRAMVGAPTGALVVASLMVGVPVGTGAPRGFVADAIGTSGLVAVPDGVGGVAPPPSGVARGMVGAPVGTMGLVAAGGVEASGLVAEADARGMVGAPIATVGLLATTGVGAGVVGARGLGAALAVAVPDAPAILRGITGSGAFAVRACAEVPGEISVTTGITGFGAAAGTNLTGLFASAEGNAAEGTAGGASEALSVTRTVSFLRVTLEVCSDGGVFSFM